MKKLLAIAVSVAAFPALAATWTGAATYRDSLGKVYSDLGCVAGTSCFSDGVTTNGTAANEYAELLYRIDNLDDTITIVTLSTDASGKLIALGGDPDGGFSMAEVLVQVETFIDAVEEDLFGDRSYDVSDSDGWSHGSADGSGNITGETDNSGLATVRLGRIVDAVNAANTILSDSTATKAAKKAAVDWFYDGTGSVSGGPSGWAGFGDKNGSSGEAEAFNNAVDALSSISSGLGGFEDASDFTEAWILNGTPDTTYSVTGYSAGNRNITKDAGTNKQYNSYTDYVTNTKAWQRISYSLSEILDSSGVPTDISVSGIPAYVQFENTNGGDGQVTIKSSEGIANSRTATYNPSTSTWSFSGGVSGTFTTFQAAVDAWVTRYASDAPNA